MNVFGIGLPEMILILVIALLVFGPKKLPEIGRSLGKAIKGFQEASNEFQAEFQKEAHKMEESVKMKAELAENSTPESLSSSKSSEVSQQETTG